MSASENPYTLDPFDNFCAISGHQTLFLGEKLYITPGFARVYISPDVNRTASSPWIRVIDLSSSFSLDQTRSVSSVLPTSIIPVDIPNVQVPAFWFDSFSSSIIYAQGVPTVEGGVIRDPSLRSFGSRGKSWIGNYDSRNQSFAPWEEVDTPFNEQRGLASSFRKVFDPVKRKGYIYGGSVQPDDGSTRIPNRQLLTYDAATMIWTNGTTEPGVFDVFGTAIPYRAPRGELLSLIFGGRLNDAQLDMDTIYIHDTESNTWHKQRTNGPMPNGRQHFCAIPITSADNSSTQVIIYGGLGSGPYSDIFALSLPSFTWTRLEASSPDLLPGPSSRLQPTCNIINNHILAVFGGRNLADGDTARCDNNQNALFMYDLNEREWIMNYNASNKAIYRVPEDVYRAIGGNEFGGATRNGPPDGFDTPQLDELFGAKTSQTPPIESDTPQTGSSRTNRRSPNIGAIVGGVVGGIIIAAIVIAYLIWRRRRKTRQTNDPSHNGLLSRPGIQAESHNGVQNELLPIAGESQRRTTPFRMGHDI
ncbi:hypothetical protein TWF106_002197 [Orbilia oligospora]|uniref:Kelch repeat protein n=1 Tax=Orbilia oligospora TaxID=2813651 RepID=A0A6G1M729_ORBOL|nr:hypothetical protein TWF679_010942 [Orbilia oligospora]KAF3224521.1 hypothetical protein TWF191_005989 [Orbilia oligospora]KAF3225681.1 hypothetical protein TWF106_002197 [Orbilia oligospora]KAF3248282.1 hypothetical protein TWF192_006279 [Orbilia oligospora]